MSTRQLKAASSILRQSIPLLVTSVLLVLLGTAVWNVPIFRASPDLFVAFCVLLFVAGIGWSQNLAGRQRRMRPTLFAPVEVEVRPFGHVTILVPHGPLTLGSGDDELRDAVNALLAQGCRAVVLNLDHVPYIDASGLGEIVRTHSAITRQGGTLKLVNVHKRIDDLLSITHLNTVLDVTALRTIEVFESNRAALNSFGVETGTSKS